MTLVLPRPCPFCDVPLETHGPLCPACWSGLEVSAMEPPAPVACAAAASLYAGAVAAAWARCKYGGELWRGHHIGEAMARLPWPSALLQCDAVVAVPMHWSRRMARGFNQASLLALPMARRLGVPLGRGWLSRHHRGAAQAGLHRNERWKRASRWRWRGPPGVSVLLVDDIRTTGATLLSVTEAIHREGGRVGACVCLAQACAEQPPPMVCRRLRQLAEGGTAGATKDVGGLDG